jgi:hypothetical protein
MKIKIVHLLINPEHQKDVSDERWQSILDKQKQSIDCFEKLKYKFNSYTQQYSIINREELPWNTCWENAIISETCEGNDSYCLSYGHYGAYMAHKRAITQEFSNDLDALIILEGDVITELNADDFFNTIKKGYELGVERGSKICSFSGNIVWLSGNEDYWDKVIHLDEFYDVPHFLLGSLYMVFKSERNNIINNFQSHYWHSPDVWLAWVYANKGGLLSHKNMIGKQVSGYSALNNTMK